MAPSSRSYPRELAAAAGAGLQTYGLIAAAVAGFAVPWLAFEWITSWQYRRWHAESAARMQADLKKLTSDIEAKPERRRSWKSRARAQGSTAASADGSTSAHTEVST